ncbi:hypothetical protein [Saccharibacillus deserti]|uniref:hypothetical protein n=1 Tax=Saccharibacillus deserti TaxID=1634444 RepID=UPI0015E75C0A|nr:hypothetical protein [Saccharibacillus deserti]
MPLKGKMKSAYVLIALFVTATAVFCGGWELLRQRYVSPTPNFVASPMMNPNQTFATYLKPSVSQHPDIAAGKEALLENVPRDSVFYPRCYNVQTDRYESGKEVNLALSSDVGQNTMSNFVLSCFTYSQLFIVLSLKAVWNLTVSKVTGK